MSTDHDNFVKRIFGQLPEARTLLRATLPRRALAELELETLEFEGAYLIDKKLRARFTDLLFSVRRRGEQMLIYILVEHKSGYERDTPLQVLGYMVSAWKESWRGEGKARPLPRILPILLYHGARRLPQEWRFSELLDAGAQSEIPGMPLALDFGIRVLDLGKRTDASLLGVRQVGTALGVVSLLVMKYIRDRDLLRRLESWGPLLRELLEGPDGTEGFETVLYYCMAAAPEERSTLEVCAAMTKTAGSKAGEIVMSMAEQLRAEGRVEGRVEALAESLLLLLNARFGEDAADQEQRVCSADDDQIRSWLVRTVTAKSIGEVFDTD